MRKLIVFMSTGYCGEDAADVMQMEDDATEIEIDEEAYWMAVSHAEHYGREMCTDDCQDDDCDLEHPGNSNISAGWEDYDPEKHDCKRAGGGSFMDDFR